MASGILRAAADDMQVLGKSRVKVQGSFRPNGITGIVAGSVLGIGFTVARTAVGKYVITFASKWPRKISQMAIGRSATGVPTVCTFGVYNAAARTLELFVAQEAANALTNIDLAANVDNEISFEVCFCNSKSNY